jgi:hypothetical protein
MSWLSFHGGHFFSLIYSHFANFSSKMGKVKKDPLTLTLSRGVERKDEKKRS